MPSPSFHFAAQSALVKHVTTAGGTVVATLDSLSGVRTVAWSVVGTDDTDVVATRNATITPSGSLGSICTLTAGAAGTAGILKCTINGGINDQTGASDAAYSATAKFYVPAATSSLEVVANGEQMESNSQFGWTLPVNAAIRASGLASSATVDALAANLLASRVALADASATILLSAGRQRYLPTLTADRAITLSVTGATLGDTHTTTRSGTDRFRARFIDASSGETMSELCVPGSVVHRFDGTRWRFDSLSTTHVRQEFHVRAFGAKGDGSTDDTDAIQACIDAARFGGVVMFGAGEYLITEPLEIHDTGLEYLGMTLMGDCVGVGAGGGIIKTRLCWGAASGTTMLELWSRDCTVQGIAFWPGLGMHVDRMVDITRGPAMATCTNNQFINCRFSDEGQSGSFDYGVVVGDDIGGGFLGNSDYMHFEQCYFVGATEAGYYCPNTGGQQVMQTFFKCFFGTSAVGIKLASGSVRTDACAFGNITDVCIEQEQLGPFNMFRDTDVESCPALYRANGTNAQGAPLSFIGGRFDCSQGMIVSGEYIAFPRMGPLTIIGCVFQAAEVDAPNWKITMGHGGTDGAAVVMLGNVFPTDIVEDYYLGAFSSHLIAGNTVLDYALGVRPMTSVFGSGHAGTKKVVVQGASLSGATGTPAAGDAGTNLRGTVTVTGAATTGVVTFGTAEPNATYYLVCTPISSTGAPAAGSNRIVSIAKLAATATITVEVAPGVGNTVVFDWVLIR